jgi:hypothetical protein
MWVAQELIDQIIDWCQDVPALLRACSFVSKSWVRRSQQKLFETLLIRRYSTDNRAWSRLPVSSSLVEGLNLEQCELVGDEQLESLFISPWNMTKSSSPLTAFYNAKTLKVGGIVHVRLLGLFNSKVFFELHTNSNLTPPLKGQIVPFKLAFGHLHVSASRTFNH